MQDLAGIFYKGGHDNGCVTTLPITEQLDKFDDSIQKQLDEKLALLRSLQVSVSGYESVIIFIL